LDSFGGDGAVQQLVLVLVSKAAEAAVARGMFAAAAGGTDFVRGLDNLPEPLVSLLGESSTTGHIIEDHEHRLATLAVRNAIKVTRPDFQRSSSTFE
jgi:hypothetical protein